MNPSLRFILRGIASRHPSLMIVYVLSLLATVAGTVGVDKLVSSLEEQVTPVYPSFEQLYQLA